LIPASRIRRRSRWLTSRIRWAWVIYPAHDPDHDPDRDPDRDHHDSDRDHDRDHHDSDRNPDPDRDPDRDHHDPAHHPDHHHPRHPDRDHHDPDRDISYPVRKTAWVIFVSSGDSKNLRSHRQPPRVR
jgi:hypothetical protein